MNGINSKLYLQDGLGLILVLFLWSVAPVQFLGQDEAWSSATVWKNLDAARSARAQGTPIYRLDLTKQRLRTFPEELADWTELREIILDRNKLSTIEVNLDRWTQLIRFSAESNQLKAFPSASIRWEQLESLHLGDNLIDSIPLDIDALTRLKTLDLWSNLISHFPASLGDMKSLEHLNLEYNDMTAEEQELLKSWIPLDVELRLSAPCRCEFDD